MPTDDTYSFKTGNPSKGNAGPDVCFNQYIIIPRGTSPGVTCVSSGGTTVDSHGKSLLRKKRFLVNLKTKRNASKFAMFIEKENP